MLPAAVPETQIPFANARRLLKYFEVIIIVGVVAIPAPNPECIEQHCIMECDYSIVFLPV